MGGSLSLQMEAKERSKIERSLSFKRVTNNSLSASLINKSWKTLCVVVWRGVVWYGVVWCGGVWCGVVRCGVVWRGVVWWGVVWWSVVWWGVVRRGHLKLSWIQSLMIAFLLEWVVLSMRIRPEYNCIRQHASIQQKYTESSAISTTTTTPPQHQKKYKNTATTPIDTTTSPQHQQTTTTTRAPWRASAC